MTSPQRRSLSGRKLELYFRFANCPLQMSPEAFRTKHGASNLQIARIARVAESTADRWFFEATTRTSPKLAQLFLLGLMDWLLDHDEAIAPEFWDSLCALSDDRSDRCDRPDPP
ncbi:hypothetical protein H6F67_12525 [Microcoleus sp. FACHB-1515]|uniref:hypothetical protein n=1 Tax=Cyanophyceae TaxID=3028117 RepID=UPI001683D885|nr:hypothetical protein [Microcoleus sp. FACHB-1515]MBD2090679.1 hypothetical protein [Microcoleus sp. FACHB-1515]